MSQSDSGALGRSLTEITFFMVAAFTVALSTPAPHLYNPYYSYLRYSVPYYTYGSQLPGYAPYTPNPYQDNVLTSYVSTPNVLPTLNVLAEVPYTISNRFTVVPMLVMAKENMNVINEAHIMGSSTKKPIVTIKTKNNVLLQCTPAVKIILDEPILVYSLKTSILFPTDILIRHEDYSIPIKVGAVIAPVSQTTYVSTETPVYVNVVYAVPTRPIKIDYVNNNKDVVIDPDTQSVVVESKPIAPSLPPKNITLLTFPEAEAEPDLLVDEENEELVNRNPPIVLAPAGIVQSTQPQTVVEPFTNSKESPVLIALREEALKQRI